MARDKSFFCCFDPARTMSKEVSKISSTLVVLSLLGLLNLPSGYSHIASVIDNDGIPGQPPRGVIRGPTVAPGPSPETLDRLEQINREDAAYFSPADSIRNLLGLSPSSNRIQGLKRVSQFHGNIGSSRSDYRPPLPHTWDDEEDDGVMEQDEEETPTFVPYIGARALTNIPQFFEHLKENIEALKLSESNQNSDEDTEGEGDNPDSDQESDEGGTKDITKPAARRMKTELLVDEKLGRSFGSNSNKPSVVKPNWKPRAAGTIHYYAPSRSNFLERQQSILRRANNYNPAWLYTNLGLGKKRRR